MTRMIGIGLVCGVAVALLVLVLFAWLRRHDARVSGAPSPAQVRRMRALTDDAARLLGGMGRVSDDLDQIDILTEPTRRAVGDWLGRYETLRKDIDGA
ncbi:MAG TPA: hypothetical protein VF163_14285 [Micromonosporaceae bacterium]